MDIKLLLNNLVAPFAAGFVSIAMVELGSGATAAAIIDKAEGDLKHFLRERIGWGVDLIWGFSEFKTLLNDEMTTTLDDNKASGMASLSLPGLTPPAQSQPVQAAPLAVPTESRYTPTVEGITHEMLTAPDPTPATEGQTP